MQFITFPLHNKLHIQLINPHVSVLTVTVGFQNSGYMPYLVFICNKGQNNLVTGGITAN